MAGGYSEYSQTLAPPMNLAERFAVSRDDYISRYKMTNSGHDDFLESGAY